MIDSIFFDLVFDNIYQFIVILSVITIVLKISLRRFNVNALHPFFYFFFVFNIISYSVIILFVENLTSNISMVYYIAAAALVMIFFLRIGYASSPANIEKIFSLDLSEQALSFLRRLFVIVFIFLFIIFLNSNINTITTESRFEAATGSGLLIRAIEASAVILMCFFPLKGSSRKYLPSSILIGVLFFAISSTIVAGSKGGALEAFLWFVFFSDRLGRRISKIKIISWIVLSLTVALIVLWYNLNEIGIDAFSLQGQYSNMPLIFEKLLVRLIASGDMYYFTLSPGVEHSISVAYGLFQIPFQILGTGFVNSIANIDLGSNEPGRQAYLYWYPNAPMGGPTNHLDLAFYFYIGPILGIFGVAVTSFVIGWLHGTVTKPETYSPSLALFMVIYCKMLLAFASPSVAIQRVVDALLLMLVALIIMKLISVILGFKYKNGLFDVKG